MKRIPSIDIVRGIVMIIMALDHVRDLIHAPTLTEDPTNLATTNPLLFFTRFITHLCAPTFVFLAGTSVYLNLQKQNDILAIRSFLIKRGLWLLVLEFTLVNFGLFFDIGFHLVLFEVIAAIGFGFIILALLLKMRAQIILFLGIIIIACHQLFSMLPLNFESAFVKIGATLFTRAAIPIDATHVFIMAYPPIPWLGIMCAGFGAGMLFKMPQDQRKRLLIRYGLISLAIFIVLRVINDYGDPAPWTIQKDAIFTALSFLNISKYPPSLIFCSATLGVTLLLLAFTENVSPRFAKITAAYGKVPLFYFVVHFYLIHSVLLCILLFQGYGLDEMQFANGTFGRPAGSESGLSLGWIYVIWILIVAVLYKPCQWYARYKETHAHWWLRYL